MICTRFLSLFLFGFLFHTSYAQFDLVRDFDEGSVGSLSFKYTGVVYSAGSKMLVQYDSVAGGNFTNISALAALDAAGNSQFIAFSSIDNVGYVAPFFDFKTLPDGKVAFVVIESATSYKIIVTNGTKAGTTAVHTSSSSIKGLEILDNGLYFTTDGNPNQSLMKIDLTTLTVSEVVEFGYFHNISDISKVSNSTLIFMAPDADDDNILKLYVSDGTEAGTTPLAVVNGGSEVSQNSVMTQVGSKVYFFYKLPGTDCCNDLWVTDGTVAGSKKIKEFNIVYFSDYVIDRKAIAFNDKFYFAGVETGANMNTDEVLWVSDGTTAGTLALTEPAENSMYPRYLTVFNNALYFLTFNSTIYENKLYKTDGTIAGTNYIELKHNTYSISAYNIVSDGEYLYMGAGNVNSNYGFELYRYDGIHAQCDVLEGISGGASSQPENLYIHEGKLYFTAYTTTHMGKELYTTGGDFTPGIATATRSSSAILCTVYPNPAKDAVTVKSTEPIVSLRLISQLGAVLSETSESSLNVSSYPAGVYYVEVLFENNLSSYQKLILNK